MAKLGRVGGALLPFSPRWAQGTVAGDDHMQQLVVVQGT